MFLQDNKNDYKFLLYQYFESFAFVKWEKLCKKNKKCLLLWKKDLCKNEFLQNFAMIYVAFLSYELRCHLYKQLGQTNLSNL